MVAAGSVNPALLGYSLPDATLLVGVRVAEIRDTPLGRFVLSEIAGEGGELESFVKTTGFDPRKQIDDAVFSSAEGRWLIAARGTFPRQALARVAESAGAKVEMIGQAEFVAASKEARDFPAGRPMAFALLSETEMLAGDEQSVRQALERRTAVQAPQAALAKAAGDAAGVYPVWFAARAFPQAPPGELPLSGAILKSVESASGGLSLGTPMMFHASLKAATPEEAGALANVMRFVTQMAATEGSARNAPLASAFAGAQVSTEDRTARLAMPVTVELLRALFAAGGTAPGAPSDAQGPELP